LSVLLRFTDSDYPFGIFKLFLLNKSEHCQLYHDGNTRMMMLVFWFTLSWVFIEVDHWNSNTVLAMPFHSDTSFQFQDNPSMVLFLNMWFD